MSKREIRRRMAESVKRRQGNQRYARANRLDDLYDAALKKKKRSDRQRRGISTTFPIPASVTTSEQQRQSAPPAVLNPKSKGSPRGSQSAASGPSAQNGAHAGSSEACPSEETFVPPVFLRERAEILLLAVCITYSIILETGEDIGYWGKKAGFAATVAILFVIHRLDAGSTAYFFDPVPWRGCFRFALSFGWAIFMFSIAKTSAKYNFMFRTGVAAVAFATRHEALPKLIGALRRWRHATARGEAGGLKKK